MMELTGKSSKPPKIKQEKPSEKPKVELDLPKPKVKDEVISEISAQKEDGMLGFAREALIEHEKKKDKIREETNVDELLYETEEIEEEVNAKEMQDISLHHSKPMASHGKEEISVEQPKVWIPGYKVVKELGKGGFGTVYLAIDKDGNEKAVKVIHAKEKVPKDLEDRIKEVRGKIADERIVTVSEYDLKAEEPYLVMKYVNGKALDTKQKERSLLKKTRIGKELTELIDYLHEKGIVHGDLKPSNIIEGPEGKLYLVDVELAQMKKQKEGLDESLRTTALGGDAKQLFGTIKYMAPEIIAGQKASDKSDIYSLGVVLYELFTEGEMPGSEAREELKERHVPDKLVEVVIKAIKKDLKKRYQNCGELMKDLAPIYDFFVGREEIEKIKEEERKRIEKKREGERKRQEIPEIAEFIESSDEKPESKIREYEDDISLLEGRYDSETIKQIVDASKNKPYTNFGDNVGIAHARITNPKTEKEEQIICLKDHTKKGKITYIPEKNAGWKVEDAPYPFNELVIEDLIRSEQYGKKEEKLRMKKEQETTYEQKADENNYINKLLQAPAKKCNENKFQKESKKINEVIMQNGYEWIWAAGKAYIAKTIEEKVAGKKRKRNTCIADFYEKKQSDRPYDHPCDYNSYKWIIIPNKNHVEETNELAKKIYEVIYPEEIQSLIEKQDQSHTSIVNRMPVFLNREEAQEEILRKRKNPDTYVLPERIGDIIIKEKTNRN